MSIKQFNGNYLPGEDRLMFRFNTVDNSEYRLWLSRRVTLFILVATEHLVEQRLTQNHTPPAAKAIAQFEHDAAKTQADFSVPYQGALVFPLGPDPVLVTDVKCTILVHDGQDLMSLDLSIVNHRNLNLKLPLSILLTMRLLLERLADTAQWGRASIAKPKESNDQFSVAAMKAAAPESTEETLEQESLSELDQSATTRKKLH
jgi:hypothetical protein